MSRANRFRFRAWNSATNKMSKALRADGFASQSTYLADVLGYYDHQPYRVLMQSTGLLDCKGVEIFEDDLLVNQHDTSGISQMIWSDDGYWGLGDLDSYPLAKYALGYFWEVIGNVYENPELLEAT